MLSYRCFLYEILIDLIMHENDIERNKFSVSVLSAKVMDSELIIMF